MGSELQTIQTLLKDQLNLDELTVSSDPSITLLTTYINRAIRKIAALDKPSELLSSSMTTVNIVANQNYVTFPSTLLVAESVFYKSSDGKWKELQFKSYKDMVQMENANSFYDTNNTGDPQCYTVRGGTIVLNKHFDRSEAGCIGVIGIIAPTVLAGVSDACQLPMDWDMLIVCEAAVMFYVRDDDSVNQSKFNQMAMVERANLRLTLDNAQGNTVPLDPRYFR